jgi:hypothetical protein
MLGCVDLVVYRQAGYSAAERELVDAIIAERIPRRDPPPIDPYRRAPKDTIWLHPDDVRKFWSERSLVATSTSNGPTGPSAATPVDLETTSGEPTAETDPLDVWYTEWVQEHPHHSEKEVTEAAKAQFGPKIRRHQIRGLMKLPDGTKRKTGPKHRKLR